MREHCRKTPKESSSYLRNVMEMPVHVRTCVCEYLCVSGKNEIIEATSIRNAERYNNEEENC